MDRRYSIVSLLLENAPSYSYDVLDFFVFISNSFWRVSNLVRISLNNNLQDLIKAQKSPETILARLKGTRQSSVGAL